MKLPFLLALGLLTNSLVAADSPASPPPSILLVTVDTLRADRVGCYGYAPAETPNLDRLAAAGVRFEHARSQVPLTLPSHATILTGRLPPRHRVRGNGLFCLGSDVPTLAAALGDVGYDTAAVVSSVVLDRIFGLDQGFDHYDDNQRFGARSAFDYRERGASQVARAATEILARLEPPFFLWVHLYDPHTPWVAPRAFAERHPKRPYDAEISFADAAFGIIWERVRERAGDHLLVVATSDHGESLGEHGENQHGFTLHRGVLQVPLLIAGPGIPSARVIVPVVGLDDLAPTLASLAGASLPGVDGQTLEPLWTGSKRPLAKPQWEETLHPLYDCGWAPLRGFWSPDWHFIAGPRPELYDSRSDPADQHDLAAAKPQLVSTLSRRLEAMAERLGDLAEPPPTLKESAESRQKLAQLAALGYLPRAPASRPGTRLDPKDGLPGWLAVEATSQLLARGSTALARKQLEPHLRSDPENPRLWHQWGRILAAIGEGDRADRAFRKALALDNRSEYLKTTYAEFLRHEGRTDQARVWYHEVLTANPRAVDATLALADLALAAGNPDQAEKLLLEAFNAGVRDPQLLDRLGYRAKARGDHGAAHGYFTATLDLDPADPAAHLELGRLELRARRFGNAFAHFDRCFSGARAYTCRMETARGWLLAGNLGRAREFLRLALEVASKQAERQEAQSRLTELDRLGDKGPPQR